MVFRRVFVLLTVFLLTVNIFAIEINDGNIRLSINEKTGYYSLYYLTNPEIMRYEPLFYVRDPKSSYLSVNIDGEIYRLGKSREFTVTVEENAAGASVIYQSSYITVVQNFTPVKTLRFPVSNGVKIDITIYNTGNMPVSAGLRMLLDTMLGEGRKKIPFVTNNLEITNELLVEGSSDQLYWISRNQNLSLMGTIVNPVESDSITPDYIHFASWKRLHKAQWNLKYVQDRSFSYRPYHAHDSAVCYFYEQNVLMPENSVTFTVFLSTEDTTWYNVGSAYDFTSYQTTPDSSEDNYIDPDYLLLLRMQEVLAKFIAGEILLNEQDLDEIEGNINRLKAKFDLP